MTDSREAHPNLIKPARERRPLHPVVAWCAYGGMVTFSAGVLGWTWQGEWRFAVTGLLLAVLLLFVGGVAAATR